MRDLFDTITERQTTRRRRKRSKVTERQRLAAYTLTDALGGSANLDSWLDLDHAIAASSPTRVSAGETDELNFEPGPLEVESDFDEGEE